MVIYVEMLPAAPKYQFCIISTVAKAVNQLQNDIRLTHHYQPTSVWLSLIRWYCQYSVCTGDDVAYSEVVTQFIREKRPQCNTFRKSQIHVLINPPVFTNLGDNSASAHASASSESALNHGVVKTCKMGRGTGRCRNLIILIRYGSHHSLRPSSYACLVPPLSLYFSTTVRPGLSLLNLLPKTWMQKKKQTITAKKALKHVNKAKNKTQSSDVELTHYHSQIKHPRRSTNWYVSLSVSLLLTSFTENKFKRTVNWSWKGFDF